MDVGEVLIKVWGTERPLFKAEITHNGVGLDIDVTAPVVAENEVVDIKQVGNIKEAVEWLSEQWDKRKAEGAQSETDLARVDIHILRHRTAVGSENGSVRHLACHQFLISPNAVEPGTKPPRLGVHLRLHPEVASLPRSDVICGVNSLKRRPIPCPRHRRTQNLLPSPPHIVRLRS